MHKWERKGDAHGATHFIIAWVHGVGVKIFGPERVCPEAHFICGNSCCSDNKVFGVEDVESGDPRTNKAKEEHR